MPPNLLIKAPDLPALPTGVEVSQPDATATFVKWAAQYHLVADQCDDLIDAVNILHPTP